MVYPDGSMYGSVKAAVSHLTKCAAKDPRMGEKELTYGTISMKRWCTPKEIGKAVFFLGSEWSHFITDMELMIDGGGSLTCKDDRQHEA